MFNQEDKKRLKELLRRAGTRKREEKIFAVLNSRYSERHRVYHTAAHIQHSLEEFDRVRDMLIDPDAVELAIWFHDVILFPGEPDNEECSAGLAQVMLFDCALPEEKGMRVAKLIMATKHDGKISPGDPDAIMMADIDLSPLGAYLELFDENTQRIRRETRLSNEDFLKKQAHFLIKLLRRDSIYGTDFFHDKYERQARRNIKRLALMAGVAT